MTACRTVAAFPPNSRHSRSVGASGTGAAEVKPGATFQQPPYCGCCPPSGLLIRGSRVRVSDGPPLSSNSCRKFAAFRFLPRFAGVGTRVRPRRTSMPTTSYKAAYHTCPADSPSAPGHRPEGAVESPLLSDLLDAVDDAKLLRGRHAYINWKHPTKPWYLYTPYTGTLTRYHPSGQAPGVKVADPRKRRTGERA
jgi:hypothetical protein